MDNRTSVEDRTNGHDEEEYEALLDELQRSGVVADGDRIGNEGMPLLEIGQQRPSNASILASVPNAQQFYDKQDKIKALLLDLMDRTFFRSRNEVIYFLDWVDWCEEFGVGFDAPIRYVVAINSEGGKSREQYTDAITTYRLRSYANKYADKSKPKHTESPLS